MTRHRRLLTVLVLGAASVLTFVGCATPSASDIPIGAGTPWPGPPEGEVTAQGTVLDTGDDPQLCLGAIAESYPPQCSGIPLAGWGWEELGGSETANGVTWGAFAVQGTYDGEVFTLTQEPIPLALYDPIATPDTIGDEPGPASEEQLVRVQDDIPERFGDAFLMSFPENGRLLVDVVWDDGTWQDAADADYGEGVVVIRSALTPAR